MRLSWGAGFGLATPSCSTCILLWRLRVALSAPWRAQDLQGQEWDRQLPLHLSSMQTWRDPLGFGELLCVVEHVQGPVRVQLELSFAHGSAQVGTWRMSEPSMPSVPFLLAGELPCKSEGRPSKQGPLAEMGGMAGGMRGDGTVMGSRLGI